jgi:hypothetical protein
MRSKILLAGTCLALIGLPAMAQNANPNAVRVAGTVESLTADSIVVKTNDGKTEMLKLAPNVTVLQNKKASVKDIKNNDFVASAAVMGADGKLHSTELRIFPEAMRGVGEGQRPMADGKQIMTNATVSGVAMIGESGSVKVKLPNMDSELIVDPGVPVTAIVVADKGMVKAGTAVVVTGSKGDYDGSETAARITIQ